MQFAHTDTFNPRTATVVPQVAYVVGLRLRERMGGA